MFQVGDYIVYGGHGVCQVKEIGLMKSSIDGQSRNCYTLVPCYSKETVIFTPVDNKKVIMRQIMTREEAEGLIDHMKEAEPLKISDEKRREQSYKDAMRTCEADQLVKMIKAIYQRSQRRTRQGKKATDSDSRYFKMAEDCLYGELALSLEIDKKKVGEYIKSRIGNE